MIKYKAKKDQMKKFDSFFERKKKTKKEETISYLGFSHRIMSFDKKYDIV